MSWRVEEKDQIFPARTTAQGVGVMRLIDLTGKRFGRLIVTGYAGEGRKWAWSCVCDCSTRVLIRGDFLRRRITKSCGCLRKELSGARSTKRRIDLTGKRFGRWTVTAYAGNRNWSCVCDCDTTGIVVGAHLRSGQSKSCGCLAKELSREHATKHGMHGTPEYRSWRSMKDRCLNPNHVHYESYGGRGIPIYDDYIPSFEAFYADMGSRPPGCSLDRIDVNGGYMPGNMQWAPAKQQTKNRRPPRRRRKPAEPPSPDDDEDPPL